MADLRRRHIKVPDWWTTDGALEQLGRETGKDKGCHIPAGSKTAHSGGSTWTNGRSGSGRKRRLKPQFLTRFWAPFFQWLSLSCSVTWQHGDTILDQKMLRR